MFPTDYQVNVRRGDGPVRRYTLLENQNDKYLVVIHPDMVDQMNRLAERGNHYDDELVALLADEAMVIDRRRGTVLSLEQALKAMGNSEHPSIRRAAQFRQPLPEIKQTLDGDDLAWAFSLEVAKRRMIA